jgi:DNA-binding transcriptional regulator YdaS (Cro superfamily)
VLLYAAVQLPASFAPAAGWGDIFVSAVAPAVAWVVHRLSLRLNQTERKQDNDQT